MQMQSGLFPGEIVRVLSEHGEIGALQKAVSHLAFLSMAIFFHRH
jgi:hypothetical protein